MHIEQLGYYINEQPTVLVLIIAGIILSIIFTLRSRGQKAYRSKVRLRAIQTTGTVIIRHADPLATYLAYSYQHEGKTWYQMQSVTSKDANNASEGTAVRVYYLPEDPKQSILADIEMASGSRQLAFILWTLTGMASFWYILFALVALYQPAI